MIRFQTIVDKNFGFKKMCTVRRDFFFLWNHFHYIAQEWSAFTYAICSMVIKFLEIVLIHMKGIMSETEITQERWREFLVLKEGPNSTCSMSKLIASYLSLVLRGRKRSVLPWKSTLQVNGQRGFPRHLFKILIFTLSIQDSMLCCVIAHRWLWFGLNILLFIYRSMNECIYCSKFWRSGWTWRCTWSDARLLDYYY